MIREVLGWEPSISLRRGLEVTYGWISDMVGVNTKTFSWPAATAQMA